MNYKFFRAGRALLNWTQAELSVKAGVGLSALVAFESGSPTNPANIAALQAALVAGGVIFHERGVDSAEAVLDRFYLLTDPTPEQKAEAIIAAGVLRRAGGRRALPQGKAAEILRAAAKARNEDDQ
jgi:transcriptional regulator with XRE-family HTH domain